MLFKFKCFQAPLYIANMSSNVKLKHQPKYIRETGYEYGDFQFPWLSFDMNCMGNDIRL